MSVCPLGQYMTPVWAGHELWSAFFSEATERDLVLEPTCGDGRMLAAVPGHIPAVGVEIDPGLAEKARARTGRRIITGDLFDVELPSGVTITWGNPPFSAKFMDRMLSRLQDCCVEGAQAGFIIPAYFLQNAGRVLRWNRLWTVGAEILPRTIFARLSKPIVFAIFTKDPLPRLRGLRLYAEAEAVSGLNPAAREEMISGSGLWKPLVVRVLAELGGEAHLGQIYQAVAGRRPSSNRFWHEKIRQTLQRGPFTPMGSGVWKLNPELA
jgi:site-specific DNA-methyltransferase (adenine-specific)